MKLPKLMESRKVSTWLWILPVLCTYLLPVMSADLDCTKCTCNLDERPSVLCRGKQLTSIPKNLPPNLKFLDLSHNSISRIEENDLQMLEDLETLSIEKSEVTYIHPRAFRNMYHLQTINLQKNLLSEIPASLFQHMSRMEELNLNGNRIRNISRYSFLTLQNIRKIQVNKNVKVKLSENPVECGCEMLALKHWLTERNTDDDSFLEIDDLKCSNSDNLPLNDMDDASFACNEEDPSVFEDDLRCMRCEGETSEDCDRNGSLEECKSEDGNSICSNSLTLKNEVLSVKKGCSSYVQCMKNEQRNPINCTFLSNVQTQIQCHFCCIGELCNIPNVGGRVMDHTYFMELSISGGIYHPALADKTSKKYQDLKDSVEAAMKETLSIKIGGLFHLESVTFSAPGLNVFFKLNGKMFIQYDNEQTMSAVRTAIEEALKNRESLLMQLNVSRYQISTEATLFCFEELQNTSKGAFLWPQTAVGKTIQIKCPHSPSRARILMQASRICSEVSGVAIWMDPNLEQCPYASEMTRRLEDLARTQVTSENMLNVSRQLQGLLSEAASFSQEDIKFSVTIVEKLAKVSTFGKSRAVINNTIAAVSSVLGAPSGVLLESEQRKQATTRLLSSVNYISNTVSLTEGDLVLVQPNLAVAAVGVDPRDFAGVSFITDSSQAQDDSLAGGEVEVQKGNGTVTGDTKSAIFLPSNLFTSLKSQGVDRVTFTIYPTDKVFSVFEEARQGPSANPTGRGAEQNTGNAAPSEALASGSPSAAASRDGVVVGDGAGGKSTRMINSRILAATVPNLIVTNLSDPVIIHLPHLKKNAVKPECVYWKESAGSVGWSSDGCVVKEYLQDHFTTCACDHLTNFALLMDVYDGGSDISEQDRLALSVISYIGCGISLMCLILTLFTYLTFRKLRRDNPSKILVNLCIALAIANLIFLVGMQDYTFANPVACKVVAVMLHYFLLSALTWMAVEAFYMYLALVLVFKTYFTNFILKCCVIGWGVPLVIIAITLGVNSTDNYGLLVSGICWIKIPAFYIAFLAPVAAILLLNFTAFGLVLRQLLGLTSRKLNKTDQTSTATQLRGAVGVVILLGLTWIFAVFAIGQASVVFYYLFAITNSLQGLFIFIFYCLFKKDALSAWRRKLPCCEVVDEKSGDRTTSRDRMNQVQGYSTPVSNTTVRQNISSNSGSTNSTSDVNMRGRGETYQISRDIGSQHDPVESRTSTSI